MKKSLLALAALTALTGVAYAQSTVTLSGNFKAGLASTKYSGAAGGSGLSVADGSSRLIITINEDLGGGLVATAQNDTRFRVDDNGGAPTSSPLAGGNTFIGLRGGFGQIQLGKLDTHYCLGSDTHGTRSTALQASSCALLGFGTSKTVTAGVASYVVGGQAIANTSRSTNILRYTTPSMGGAVVQLNYSPSFASAEGSVNGNSGKGSAIGAQVNMPIGPLSVGASYWNAKVEDKTRAEKAGTVALGYNAGFMTVGLTYDRSATNGASRTVLSVPVTVPVGMGTFLATFSKAGDTELNSVKIADSGATLIALGYDYALSKRTSMGVSYARLTNGKGARYNLYTQAALNGTPGLTANDQDPSQLYFGMRHAF